ncbi:MAG: hypothetical protein U0361_00010, partial [Nitrospiraceae bacterium]
LKRALETKSCATDSQVFEAAEMEVECLREVSHIIFMLAKRCSKSDKILDAARVSILGDWAEE